MENEILCISSEKLFQKGKWNGIKREELNFYLELLKNDSEFRVRRDLEEDSRYKQIIAQVILRHDGKYFLHRQVKANEERLNSLCPLPLGGHIETFDVVEDQDIIEIALDRELHEEAEVNANVTDKELFGLVYIEDGNPVNEVHVGLIYIFDLDSDDVKMREEGLETVGWVYGKYLSEHKDELTYWSRVFVEEYFS